MAENKAQCQWWERDADFILQQPRKSGKPLQPQDQPHHVIASIFMAIRTAVGKEWLYSKFAPHFCGSFRDAITVDNIVCLDEGGRCVVPAEFLVFIRREINLELWLCRDAMKGSCTSNRPTALLPEFDDSNIQTLTVQDFIDSNIQILTVQDFIDSNIQTLTVQDFIDKFISVPISFWMIQLLIERILPKYGIIIDLVVLTPSVQCGKLQLRYCEWASMRWTGTSMPGLDVLEVGCLNEDIFHRFIHPTEPVHVI